MTPKVIIYFTLLAPIAFAFPQNVVIVNGRTGSGQETSSLEQEEAPFIVVGALVANDADPNEPFIPTNDENDGKKAKPNLLSQADLARELLAADVIESDDSEGSSGFIPTNDNGANKAGFKLLSKEDLARESSVVISANDEQPRLLDIPRDTSGPDQPFFKLPLPDEGVEEEDYDDVVVVAVGDDDEEQGRGLGDIPRDTSAPNHPGFKLPLPIEEVYEDDYSDVEIIEAGDDDDQGRSLGAAIPLDKSGQDQAGGRLPKRIDDEPLDVEIIEVGDDDEEEVDCFAKQDPGTCLNTHEAWFYDHTHNKCHEFAYSGCGGNTNRFFTEEACMAKCKDAKRSDKKKEQEEGDVSRCLEEPKTGLCKALLKYWYYNADRQACEEFTYGGCEAGSSPNKFPTKDQCQNACKGVKRN